MAYGTLFLNVTNGSINFTSGTTAGTGWSTVKPGDLAGIRTTNQGTILLEIATVDKVAKTGTFTAGFIGTTASNLFTLVIPTSKIDPTADTVVKTQLINDVAAALRADQLNAANWQQVLSVETGNVDVTLPDGSKVTGPSWRGILNATINKDTTTAQSVKSRMTFTGDAVYVGNATTATNLDVYGFSMFRQGVTFAGDVASQRNVIIDAPDNTDYALVQMTRVYTTADPRMYTGGSCLARLTVGKGMGAPTEVTTQMQMQLRHLPGQDESGFVAYQAANGNWIEARWKRDGNIQNISGQWQNSSDVRIKTEIKEIEDPIALIRGLKLYSYLRDGTPDIGCIAQEVQKTIPEAVSSGGSYTMQTTGDEVPDCLGVSYGTLGYVALAALNKALDRIEALEAKVAELQK
ncbi:hypothetical protein RF55_1859 [Lasius niger]|uniref:Peptidase S74 domain-containing protein n=1 Tax=Lasius niger TaxID=67767 RepID=A0A0J7NZF5_LASNI|nr:hypothetical protein RF55_1859 [Lasius niger]